jgi:hypothetical protein
VNGAQGGSQSGNNPYGGLGGSLVFTFKVSAGTVLSIDVGQQGGSSNEPSHGGGGAGILGGGSGGGATVVSSTFGMVIVGGGMHQLSALPYIFL